MRGFVVGSRPAAPYPVSRGTRGFFLASLLGCKTKSFASLVFRVVSLFTFQIETSATSRLYFLLSMRFRYPQNSWRYEFVNSRVSIFWLICCAKVILHEFFFQAAGKLSGFHI